MIGDVNIFLYGVPPTYSSKVSEAKGDEVDSDCYAEVEIMVAGPFSPRFIAYVR